MWKQYDGVADGRVNVWFGARTPGGVSTAFLTKMCAEAKARNIHITMHCLEEEMDHEAFAELQMSRMEYCDSIGLLSDRTVLIHMCWVEGDDITRLSKAGTHIAHCPASNIKLASGFCPVPQLLKVGRQCWHWLRRCALQQYARPIPRNETGSLDTYGKYSRSQGGIS